MTTDADRPQGSHGIADLFTGKGIAASGMGEHSATAADAGQGPPTSGQTEQGRDLRVRSWDDERHWYREEWERRAGGQGTSWENVEPAFRYGHEMATDPRYRDREWDDAEPNLIGEYDEWSRRAVGRHGGDEPWDQARENVRTAWNRTRGR